MAITYTYVKGKIKHTTGENTAVIRYPETTIDKIVAWVDGNTAGVSILDNGRIKPDYLPSVTVYKDASTGKIDTNVIPDLDTSIITGGTFSSEFLPSNVVYTSGGTVDSSVIPGLNASIITEGTLDADRLPTIAVSKIAVSGGTLNVAIIPDIPATKLTGIISKSNLPGSVDDIVDIKSVSESAPSATGVVIGDQYIKKTTTESGGEPVVTYKVMTAVSAGTWEGATESNPVENVIYYVPGSEKSYRYSGSSIVEIAAQRAVTTTVRETGASDDLIPTELAVRSAITASSTPMASIDGATAGSVYLKNSFNGTVDSSDASATTINAVDSYFAYEMTNDVKGITTLSGGTTAYQVNIGEGLTYSDNAIAISLTSSLVGATLHAGNGIESVSGATITAELEWQDD